MPPALPSRSAEPSPTGGMGWAWIWRSLLLRKWRLGSVFLMTAGVYASGLAQPVLAQRAVDAILAGASPASLLGLGGGALAAMLAEALLTYRRQALVIELGSFLDRRVARRAFLHLMRMRIDAGAFEAGQVLNRFEQAGKIRRFVLDLTPQAVFDTGNAVVSLLLMVYYDAAIGVVVLTLAAGCGALLRRRLGRFYASSEAYFAAVGRRQGVLSETVSAIATIKALALERTQLGRWMASTDAVVDALRQVSELARGYFFGDRIISRGLTLLVVALGCLRVFQGALTVGELLALQLLVARVTAPILASADILRQYQEVNVAVAALGRFLAEPEERASARPPVTRPGRGGIDVRDLGLRYPGRPEPALERVAFSLPDRGVFALVGRNGSGKSSLLRVLLGLQRDFEGSVAVAGHEIRHYHPRRLRAHVGVVDQDTVLLSGTIREAIAGGSGADDGAVRAALAFAEALAFVEAMPGGLDAELQENGRNLSGGQRQRLSIARAVVRDPPVALLDEPTAFLDPEAALSLERKLTAWGRERLMILVSHHLAATRGADRILVLDGGRLVGDGSHEALLRSCEAYARLWGDYARSLEGKSAG